MMIRKVTVILAPKAFEEKGGPAESQKVKKLQQISWLRKNYVNAQHTNDSKLSKKRLERSFGRHGAESRML